MAWRHAQLLVTMPQPPVLTPAPSVELTATCDHSRVGLPSTHGAKVAPSKRNNQRRCVAITAVAQAKLQGCGAVGHESVSTAPKGEVCHQLSDYPLPALHDHCQRRRDSHWRSSPWCVSHHRLQTRTALHAVLTPPWAHRLSAAPCARVCHRRHRPKCTGSRLASHKQCAHRHRQLAQRTPAGARGSEQAMSRKNGGHCHSCTSLSAGTGLMCRCCLSWPLAVEPHEYTRPLVVTTTVCLTPAQMLAGVSLSKGGRGGVQASAPESCAHIQLASTRWLTVLPHARKWVDDGHQRGRHVWPHTPCAQLTINVGTPRIYPHHPRRVVLLVGVHSC